MKKSLVTLARLIVGLLFLFSGFVKLVDPLGFSYKLDEYFGPGVFNLPFLQNYALIISISVIIIEFILGAMLLLGYAKNLTRWAILLMIVFFTFLTFYSAYFNKVTDCGCFGDAIPLTPWQSFGKDVILLVLILFIFFNHRFIRPVFRTTVNKWAVFIVFIGCLWVTYNALNHLPPIDFRPYKIGNYLPDQMVSKTSELPPVHDFMFFKDGKDLTDSILKEDKVLMVVSYDLNLQETQGWENVKKASDLALKNGYHVIGMTASMQSKIKALKEKYNLNFDFYLMDRTTLKTIVRSNPGLLTLHRGTVTQKAHWKDADELKFN